MKHVLMSGLLSCGLMASASALADSNPYSSGFSQALNQCEKLAQSNPDQGSGSYFSADACYKFQVQIALADDKACKQSGAHANRCASFFAQFDKRAQKAAQPQLLTAAVQAAPAYIADTVDAALTAGMNSYDVVAVATAAHPAAESTIAQRAIAYGADPSTVLQATAAGHKHTL